MSEPKSKLSRRTLFAGAGTAGAIAAAGAVLPRIVQQAQAVPQAKEPPEKGESFEAIFSVSKRWERIRPDYS